MTDNVMIGVDASTKKMGISVFKNRRLFTTYDYEFSGTYDLHKLFLICKVFKQVLEDNKPIIIVIEEPLTANSRFSRNISSLNQVAGALTAVGMMMDAKVYHLHNNTAKSVFNISNKKNVKSHIKRCVEEIYPFLKDKDLSQDEYDAVFILEAFIKLGN